MSLVELANGTQGTVILTGANGSLGLEIVRNLLQKYPSQFALLTVRNDSNADMNTAKLRKIISSFNSPRVSIKTLDLGCLSDVRAFADSVNERVSANEIPRISSIVCNAGSWFFTGSKKSRDNFDLCFQASHLSHFLIVMKLLGSMNKQHGRIVMLGSHAHDSTQKNQLNPLGACIPNNLEELVKPLTGKPGEESIRGFQRHANAKLSNVMFMHALNRKLVLNPSLKNITATAMDPGGMPNSRAVEGGPKGLKVMMSIFNFLMPVIRHFTSFLRRTEVSGVDLVTVSLGDEFIGARGYFDGTKKITSSLDSLNEKKQEDVWSACEKWVELKTSECALELNLNTSN